MKKFMILAAAAMGAMAAPASAELVVVDAAGNSSTPGTPAVSTQVFAAGAKFRVFVNPNDIWNAGPIPRWSNADGLTKDLFATGNDESGALAGTKIGEAFPLYTQAGFTAPYGALVGRIGAAGSYFLIGTGSSSNPFTAGGTGNLQLFYWDSNNGDNTDFITANVVAGIPEPATWALMIIGFGFIGAAVRGRKAKTATRGVSFA